MAHSGHLVLVVSVWRARRLWRGLHQAVARLSACDYRDLQIRGLMGKGVTLLPPPHCSWQVPSTEEEHIALSRFSLSLSHPISRKPSLPGLSIAELTSLLMRQSPEPRAGQSLAYPAQLQGLGKALSLLVLSEDSEDEVVAWGLAGRCCQGAGQGRCLGAGGSAMWKQPGTGRPQAALRAGLEQLEPETDCRLLAAGCVCVGR
jgi:hypothetical protein